MHIIENTFPLRTQIQGAILSCVTLLMLGFASTASADFTTVADVTGFSPATNGGGTSGTLVVGATDLGGLLGDGEQVLGGVTPLESPEAIIGQSVTAIGAVTLNDSASRWDVTGDLTVGDEGQGFLTIGTSATVDVDGTTVLGLAETGFGQVEVNGTNFPGARLRTIGPLTVGEAGFGRIELTNRGTLFSDDIAIVGNLDGSDGTVVITDPGSRWSVRSDLTIGNGDTGTTSAHGKVEIGNDALLQSEGAVTINPFGTVSLLGGTLRTIPSTTIIANNGIIRGDGFIDGGIDIDTGGLLSNSAASVQNGSTVTNFRESLRVSGEVTNGGIIESIGGEMIFDSLVTNNNSIIARDAILRFSNSPPEDSTTDLLNTDLLSLAGDITVIGDIDSSGGDIFTLDDTTLLLQGNLTFTSGIFGITADGDGPPISVTGAADLAGATIDLVLSSGFDPGVGEPFALLQADDGVAFPANMMDSAGGRIFDFSIVGNTLFAEDSGFLVNPIGADFNGDGIVNALDLAIWENNYPIASGATTPVGDADGDGDVDAADFMKIQRDFGIIPVPPITAVPEPSTLALALLTMVCCPRRRRRTCQC